MLHSVVEYNLFDVTKLLVFSEELCVLNDIWIICSMNNAKCVRQSFTAGQSLPPGFRAARQCFCCKEVVITHVRVARPLSIKLCTKKINISKKNEKKKMYPLRMITGPKECCTEIFRQICAGTSEFIFNKQTRYSNVDITDLWLPKDEAIMVKVSCSMTQSPPPARPGFEPTFWQHQTSSPMHWTARPRQIMEEFTDVVTNLIGLGSEIQTRYCCKGHYRKGAPLAVWWWRWLLFTVELRSIESALSSSASPSYS